MKIKKKQDISGADGHDERVVNIYKEKVKSLKLTGDRFTDTDFAP
jgi:hypothetical protein